MARLADSETTYAGVYGYLLASEESPGRLAGLRAGRPVDVPMWRLPEWARSPLRAGWPGLRAIVHADDTITVRPETAAEWLVDNLPEQPRR